jgi:hypothetical protein
LVRNQNGKRKVVVIVRERGGNSAPAVFKSEGKAMSFLRTHVAKGTILNVDEAGSWDELHKRYEVKCINHEEAYSVDGACTNWAEDFLAVCAARKSVTATISRASICSATRKRLHGVKITAAPRMVIR